MSKLSRDRGKRAELEVARYMGGKRNHFESEDIRHPVLSIEAKHRKANPRFIVKGMAQAEAAAEEGKIPVFVMHEERQEYGNSLAVMRLSDLRDLVGD